MIGDCESSFEEEASKEKKVLKEKRRKKTAAREQKEGFIEIRLRRQGGVFCGTRVCHGAHRREGCKGAG